MVKKLRLLQCLLLSVVILGAEVKKADAFFLLPPMPWDIEVDIPGNANKVVSNLKAYYRQLQTIKSELNSQKLEVLKKGQIFKDFSKFVKISEGGKNKTPGKGKLQNNAELGISKGGLDEEENFNAFHTLFFTYPPESDYPDNYPAVKTAYKHKAIEYKQDVIMETYLTGRVTEDYLGLVEKTIERLDNCQKGLYTKEEMTEHCVFFGLQMAYIEPEKAEPEGDPENSENPGQYGEIMNAYIVTTVYDRLMRMVEDLTAAEAQFMSAKQIDMVDPINPDDQQSSAEDYLDNGYRFAYNESRTYAHAKGTMLGGDYIRSEECKNGGKNCPGLNEDKAELKNADDTAILGKLQPVDEQINQAMNLHNLKAQLGEYKSQYRKYLKAKEIHERMLKVLEKSDQCTAGFFDRYSNGQGASIWYGGSAPAKANDHDSRSGLSRTVIEEYQKDTTDTILGTKSSECDGFYESCPDGYRLDETNPCQYEDASGKTVTSSTMFACVLDTVTSDTEPKEGDYPKVDFNPKLERMDFEDGTSKSGYEEAGEEIINNREYNDTDFLIDGTQADDIQTDNRVKAEKGWRIGYNHVMELTENGTLQFEPWNDQKNLQSEYLRNKYRNMRMIVKAVDEGMMSYRVAKTQAEKYGRVGPIEKVLPAVTACKLTTDATKDAWNQECGDFSGGCSVSGDTASCSGTKTIMCTCYNSDGEPYSCSKTLHCSISGSNDTGWITGSKEEGCVPTTVPIKYDQRIKSLSGGCALPKANTTYEASLEDKSGKCPGTWDFSTKFLVQKYMPAVVGSWKNGGGFESTCPGSLDSQTTHLFDNTHAAGRVVASDRFEDILKKRKEVEQRLQSMVTQYESEMKSLKAQLKSTIAARKSHSERLSQATDTKNEAVQERQRSLQRVTAIENQINDLKNNRIPALQERLAGREPKPEKLQKDLDSILTGAGEDLEKYENPTLAQKIGQIPALEEELAYICKKAPEKDKECASYSGKSNQYDPYENIEDEDDIFKNVAELENTITTAQVTMDSAQSMLDVLQDQIDSLSEQIRERASSFAKEYLAAAEQGQQEIEAVNKEFEDKLETKDDGSEPDRMVNNNRRWCKKDGFLGIGCREYSHEYKFDNLKWTMARVMFGNGTSNSEGAVDGELPGIVNDTIDERWFKNNWSQYPRKLSSVGVVRMFVVACGNCMADAGVPDKNEPYTPDSLAQAVKKQAMKEAVDALAGAGGYIPKADEIIKDEVDSAVKEITTVMEEWGVTGEDGVAPNEAIYKHANYAGNGEGDGGQAVTARHYKLIDELKQAEHQPELNAAGIKLEESFGIPSGIITDDDFFAGLPARGAYTVTVPSYGKQPEKLKFDENDGRDYMAPHRPLLNLAPIREVFYFSAMDYDDVPQENGAPSLSTLVDRKYKNTEGVEPVEYLPETWRYLLATPNMRNEPTPKYQQTFVERSYGKDKLKDYINNKDIGGKEEHYRAIIGRAGVYPCKLGGTVIDEGGGDGVGNMSFKRRSSLPAGAVAETCQEVALHKNGVRHLLADHNAKDEGKSKALQGSLGSTSEPMYTNYSELGQFLNGDLKYRPMLKNIYDYLLDENNQDNSIERQRGDLATFKRNVIGGFLEAVNAEHNAQKTLDNNKEDVVNSLKNLCTQLHNFGESVNGEACEDESDSTCADQIAEQCAAYIMDNGGLAKNAADDKYEVDCAQSSGGSYYEQIFCKLNDLKDEAIAKAHQGYSETDSDGTTVTYVGFDSLKGEASATDSDRVKERIQEIEDYFGAFEADADEVSYIQPKATKASVTEDVKEAKANWEASRAAEEEGITSMDNQSQAVAYCPVY